MNFEQYLASKGFTAADIADPNMQRALSAFRESYDSLSAKASEYETYRKDVEESWTPAANKKIEDAENLARQARLDAARYQEELKIAKDYGYMPEDRTQQAPPPAKPADGGVDLSKYVTADQLRSVASQEARAIAMTHDLSDEYNYLTGKSLREYAGQNGQTGMSALFDEFERAPAPQKQGGLKEFAANKFGFAQLRQQKSDAATKLREDAIRAEEGQRVRAEMASQYGNPLLRQPVPSKAPFIPGPKGSAEQPWNRTADQKRSDRIEKAIQSQARTSVQ